MPTLFELGLEVKTTGLGEAKKSLSELDKQGQQTSRSFSNSFSGIAEKPSAGVRKLNGEFRQLAQQVTGVNPSVAKLGEELGQFAIGGAVTGGVLLGVAAIGFAWQKFTEKQRAAREEADKLTQSLLNQAKAQYANTVAGQADVLAKARKEQADALKEVKRLEAAQRGFAGPVAQVQAYLKSSEAAKRYGNATAAAAIALNNLRKAEAAQNGEAFNGLRFLAEKAQAMARLTSEIVKQNAAIAQSGGPVAQSPQIGVTPSSTEGLGIPGTLGPISETPAKLPPIINESGKVAIEAMENLKSQMQASISSLSQVLGDGIYNAFAAAFNGEGIGGIFKEFGKTVLAGVGEIFGMMGRAYLEYGLIMTHLIPNLANPVTAGPTAIAIGVALTALSGALGAIMKGHGQGSHAASRGTLGNGTQEIVRLKFVDRYGNPSRDVEPLQPIHIGPVIGPNDPAAFHAIQTGLERHRRRKG